MLGVLSLNLSKICLFCGMLHAPLERHDSCSCLRQCKRELSCIAGSQLWELHDLASSHADEAVRRAAKAVAAIPTDSEPVLVDPPITFYSATLGITFHCVRALLKDHAFKSAPSVSTFL